MTDSERSRLAIRRFFASHTPEEIVAFVRKVAPDYFVAAGLEPAPAKPRKARRRKK
jgi:hypothetical protein